MGTEATDISGWTCLASALSVPCFVLSLFAFTPGLGRRRGLRLSIVPPCRLTRLRRLTLSASTIVSGRKSERDPLVSSSRVRSELVVEAYTDCLYKGTNLLNSQTVAIKFVRRTRSLRRRSLTLRSSRNHGKQRRPSSAMSVVRIAFSPAAVRPCSMLFRGPVVLPLRSRYTPDIPLWPGGSAQYPSHRPPRAQSRGSL